MLRIRLARIAAAVSGLLLAAAAGAQGYGPRALQLVPDNSNVVTVYAIALMLPAGLYRHRRGMAEGAR